MFLLYTRLTALPGADGREAFRGLGFLDSKSDVMNICLELTAPPLWTTTTTSARTQSGRGRHGKRSAKPLKSQNEGQVVEIELAQDTTALRSRKGDTGSVLWRARCPFHPISMMIEIGELMLGV